MDAQEQSFLTVSPPPHIKHPDTTRSLMLHVLIALAPALAWGVYIFGARVLLLTFLSVGACVGFEAGFAYLRKKRNPVRDLSAVVTGVLLAMNLPVTVPLWIPVLGAAFAILLVKALYGGIGKNILNPALAARVFLFLSFPQMMTHFVAPYTDVSAFSFGQVDAVTSATPLAATNTVTVSDLFFGLCGGCIGELSTLLLLAGGIYLFCMRVITWHIPVTYLGTVAALALCFPVAETPLLSLGYTLCSGGLMLGALFMATDYATSPLTARGRLLYGVGCGLLTFFFRTCSHYPEGVSFAILVMNLLVWYLDRATKPKPFGGKRVQS